MTTYFLLLAGVFAINVLFLIITFRLVSSIYSKKFDGLTAVVKEFVELNNERIKEAFDERDQRFVRLQTVVTQAIIRDTPLYDVMLDEETKEESVDEHPESD